MFDALALAGLALVALAPVALLAWLHRLPDRH